ncbi:flippase [Chryseobacterium oryzae]|uniref:Flippase n=1 Tax=Chryseobacterium oryzae TaxID=2929799 RepID=A0ABY4BLF1_9FLAO|nr:flippase [Chryseobacterium oryzae]UOE39077.1 flippase [Chryseobacterium oryzae]
MSGNKNLLKSVTSLGVVQIANYIFPFVTIPIVSRILGPEKIGIINYAASFALYFVLIVSYSFELTGVRRAVHLNNDKDAINSLFSKIFFSQFFLLVISFIIFIPCLLFIPFLKQDYFISFISFAFCIQSLFSQNWLFQAKQELKFIAGYNFAARSLIMVGVLVFIRREEDYIIYACIFNLVPVLVSFVLFIIAFRKFDLKLKIPKFKEVLNLINEDKIIFFSNLIISLYSTTSTVILGFYHSSSVVGFYTSAQKVVDIARNVVMRPLLQGLFPFIGAAFTQGFDAGTKLIQKILPLFLLLTITVVLSISIFGPFIVNVFFGDKFQDSVILLEVLSIGLFAIFFNMFFGSLVMLNLKMDKYFLSISIFAAVFSLILNFIFVPKYGALATSTIWTCTEFIIVAIQVFIIRKNNVNIFSREQFSISVIVKNIKNMRSLKS